MKYGPTVRVDYVEVSEPEQQTQYSGLLTEAAEQELPYPLVALNGQIALAGTAHHFVILPLVEQLLQAEASA